MKTYRILTLLVFAAIASFATSCGGNVEPDDPNKGNGGGGNATSITEINGTKIEEKTTACGLISDAKTGKGIAGVPVTDGYTYVVTDANGVYQMEANRYCRKVYMSVPAEYEIPLDPATKMPAFYSAKNFEKGKINRFDFTLTALAAPEENFTLVMIGDPQCQTDAQVKRYTSETVPDMLATLNANQAAYPNAYGITLGDVTFDSYGTWDGMKASMSNLKLGNGKFFPIFQCIGNHDHNSKATGGDYDATGKFVETFGPTDYSFNRGQAHIIVMDDIMVKEISKNSSPNSATWTYDGGFTKAQYNWLLDDLSHVADKEKKIVIFCAHIPFRGGSGSGGSNVNTSAYYSEILGLLKQFKDAHIMIGHTHYPQNYIQSGYVCKSGHPVYEHVHGAACGAWWSCNSNVTGAPNGYSLYQIKGNTVEDWVAKGTKTALDYQVRVYDGNQTYSGSKGYQFNWFNTSNKIGTYSFTAVGNASLKNCFVAEVWDDDAKNWTVEMYQNGAKVGNFTRVTDGKCANICMTSYYYNELGKTTDTYVNKTASHYWYFKPASGDPSSEKSWEVRATQKIPDSQKVNTYSCGTLTTDYSAF